MLEKLPIWAILVVEFMLFCDKMKVIMVNERLERHEGFEGEKNVDGAEEIFQKMRGSKHQRRILGTMTADDPASGFENYLDTNAESVREFLRRYGTREEFEPDAQSFLETIGQNNEAQKLAEYTGAMERFKKNMYGEEPGEWAEMRERTETERMKRGGQRTIEIMEREELIRDCDVVMLNKGDLIGQPGRECEDNMFVDTKKGIFAVFDGAGGGGKNPALASQVAALAAGRATVAMGPETEKDLKDILTVAGDAVTKNERAGITTGVMGRIMEEDGQKKLIYANVGDSRIYVIRNGHAHQITRDEGVENRIWNWLGDGGRGVKQSGEVRLREGDNLLFCSDGVTGDLEKDFIPETEMARIIENAATAKEAAKAIVRRATKKDDRTAIVVRI